MKRIFSKKEKAENEVKVKKRFLNKKIYIAIMLILILLLISILMFARSNGIKNFGDIKNFINNKLNNEEAQQAGHTCDIKDWSEINTVDSKFSYGTIFKMTDNISITEIDGNDENGNPFNDSTKTKHKKVTESSIEGRICTRSTLFWTVKRRKN